MKPARWKTKNRGKLSDIEYDTSRVQQTCLEIDFDIRKSRIEKYGYDFVLAEYKQPMIIEASYCYNAKAAYYCRASAVVILIGKKAPWSQDDFIDLLNDMTDPAVEYSVRDQIAGDRWIALPM